MKKFRNVPAIITLLAGFVTSVVMIVNKYSLKPFLWILVLVMAGFYISGIIIRVILSYFTVLIVGHLTKHLVTIRKKMKNLRIQSLHRMIHQVKTAMKKLITSQKKMSKNKE